MSIRNSLITFGVSGALALGAVVSASAGPLPIGNSGLQTAIKGDTTEIRWRGGRGIGPGLAFGLAAGALVGAVVAAQPYGYGPGYYDAPVYAEPYAYGPGYPTYGYSGYAGYGYGGCTTDEGYGRQTSCSGR
jgi:hypothetical protein